MQWKHKPFEALTALELYGLMALRQGVFVVEQRCAYLDADGGDPLAVHLWRENSLGDIDAVLRVFAPGVKYPEASVGRVATKREIRGRGAGRELMARGISLVAELHGPVAIRISAQQYLLRFYESLGFVREGDGYLEDDIPHIEMLRVHRP